MVEVVVVRNEVRSKFELSCNLVRMIAIGIMTSAACFAHVGNANEAYPTILGEYRQTISFLRNSTSLRAPEILMEEC